MIDFLDGMVPMSRHHSLAEMCLVVVEDMPHWADWTYSVDKTFYVFGFCNWEGE